MKKLTLIAVLLFSTLQATDLNDYINKANCDQIIDKQVYTICYDYEMKGAKYVAYTLDGSKVNAVNIKKRTSFYTEKNLPNKYRSHNKVLPPLSSGHPAVFQSDAQSELIRTASRFFFAQFV